MTRSLGIKGTKLLGSEDYTYGVVENWPKLPHGWEFRDVAGVAADSKDRIYVFHSGEHPLMVFDREGNLLDHWGDNLFGLAHDVRVGPDGMLYCVDHGNHTVMKITPQGDLLMTLGASGRPSGTGVVGLDYRTIRRAAGPFNRPTDIAFAPSGSSMSLMATGTPGFIGSQSRDTC